MRFDPRKCGNVIVASAILHNFGIEVGDVFQAEDVDVENEPYHVEIADDAAGAQVRKGIILDYFS